MQLATGRKKRIASLISKASLALLCSTSVASSIAAAENPNDEESKSTRWSGQGGVVYYSESESRVQAAKGAFELRAGFEGEKIWATKLSLDSLTGASPNGALKSQQPQTFTTPSGNGTYTIQPGETPLDSSFKDTRVSLSSTWTQPIDRLKKYTAGVNLSKEYDYFSAGANVTYSRETEDKNRTYTIGTSYTHDTIKPVGGAPVPLATMVAPGSSQPKTDGTETKSTTDFLFGVAQTISRKWTALLNFSLGLSSGYHTDPYKIVTVYDSTAGATLGNPTSYIYESRPDSRFKQSLFLESRYHLSRSVFISSYRFYKDDWGLNSHTLQLDYNVPLSKKWRFQPGIRLYLQSQADFYDHSVADNETAPEHITADNRLADMTALTPGVKFYRKLKNEKELSFALQYYMQSGDSHPSDAVGSQRNNDLYPDVTAYIFQMYYTF